MNKLKEEEDEIFNLVNKGNDIEDNEGETALTMADGNEKILKILQSSKAKSKAE